jgi:hypothetical protein
MPATIRVFKQLFSALCRVQQKAWLNMEPEWEIPDQAYRVIERLIARGWNPIGEKAVESLFSGSDTEVRLSDYKLVLYLPPMQEESYFIPVLTLECKLDNENDVMKLRLMLIHCNGNGGKPHGIGFRIEEGESIHGFYHAQLIKNLEGAAEVEDPPIDCPLRFPQKQPCLPLRAENSVTLVVCLLISLYGIKYCWKFINEHQLSELTRYLEYFGKPS